jgi:hypothetical protein
MEHVEKLWKNRWMSSAYYYIQITYNKNDGGLGILWKKAISSEEAVLRACRAGGPAKKGSGPAI